MALLLQLLLEHGEFFSQGSVATQLRCDGIFKYAFVAKFTTESASERILKIV